MEITLTSQELADAYYEKHRQWDEDYVMELAEMAADDDIPETVERLDALMSDRELLKETARQFRKYIDEWVDGEVENECFRDAYRVAMREKGE